MPFSLPADHRRAGFTLVELVAAIILFAFLILMVLADREDAIEQSYDARIIQTVRYLAAAKLDEIRHDPDRFGDRDSGDFDDLETDWQSYRDFRWTLELEKMVAVGGGDDLEGDFLYPGDDDEPVPVDAAGELLEPRYVRRLTLIVTFEPDGEPRPDLSVKIVTFVPPEEEEEEES